SGIWIGLEINLLSIISSLKSPHRLYPPELAIKYFITQRLASVVVLFSILILNNLNEFIFRNLNQKLSPIVILTYNLNTINFFVFISAIVRGILGLNQIRLRKISVYSSINHIARILNRILFIKKK
ncbi:NADH-ubiquinone oxidoreductase chain 2-like, partial [Leptinotarsa decemlineata]|uniref:NADH-ubiquinone oxidoreductase chain 2-like n=1 Tax=Leptinotarsa decemlineata TaxID=7539 RepID=UPI003D30C736